MLNTDPRSRWARAMPSKNLRPASWIWDQRLQHLVQLLVKGSEEISLEFHSELIPDSKYLSECESNLLYSILESGISDLTVTVQGGYPTIINIGCCPLIPDPALNCTCSTRASWIWKIQLEVEKFNLWLKPQATSSKPQAAGNKRLDNVSYII